MRISDWSSDVCSSDLLHMAVGGGEQGVILAHADVLAGMHLGAALADDDIARNDGLAAELLDAEALGLGVATVARGAASFFVCHETVSLNLCRAAQAAISRILTAV